MPDKPRIIIQSDGPYFVHGWVPLVTLAPARGLRGQAIAGHEVAETYRARPIYALCRCGVAKTMPICDGLHLDIEWDGTETADRTPARPADAAAVAELPPRIAVVPGGPFLVQGDIILKSWGGPEYPPRPRRALCRCGASKHKPFCDGTHATIGFERG